MTGFVVFLKEYIYIHIYIYLCTYVAGKCIGINKTLFCKFYRFYFCNLSEEFVKNQNYDVHFIEKKRLY